MSEPNPTLAARVRAVNRANAYANDLYPQLAEIFRPLIGQPIIRADGELTARVRKLLPEFPNGVDTSAYRHRSEYSLAWTVKTCEMIAWQTSCVYHEATVYVGRLADGILTELHEGPGLRADYRAEDVIAARAAYEAAKRAADAARDALYPFGENDR